jgi:prepilin-type N-terminal cleavage/methylation domain-containing protein/prepilin-type processing-associated H-X9-DG protein
MTGTPQRRNLPGRLRPRGAFTLVELLVVIAVIAILAGLLLPALAQAKSKAQSAACLSNVRQWVLAFRMYAEEYDDFFPYEGWIGEAIDQGKNLSAWYNVTTVYASQPRLADLYLQNAPPLPGQKSIFVCPSVKASVKPTLAEPFFMYGFNNRMDPNDPPAPAPPAQFKPGQVWRLDDTVIFTENSEGKYPSTSGLYTPARHNRRANLGFVDGHAEAIREADFRRTALEDQNSATEWSKPRRVFWYPFPGAPQ